MLTVTSCAVICGLFTWGVSLPSSWSAAAHGLLVLGFAIPGGSWGYDIGRDSRSAAIGTCAAALAGTLLASAMVLAMDWWTILR